MKRFSRRSFLSTAGYTAILASGEVLSSAKSAHAKGSAADELFTCSDFTEEGGFTSGVEGPACDKNGNLYAVNFSREGTIGKITPEGNAELFVTLPSGSIGNGIRFDSHDTMLVADYTGHNILAVNPETREISVLAHESTMNQPNDIAITSTDIIFASDPNWSKGTGNVWRIESDGIVTKADSMSFITNGIEVSPDETKLYVNTSSTPGVYVYDLDSGGNISNRRLLGSLPGTGADGMRCDVDGNLFVTRPGQSSVTQLSPDGAVIRQISTTGKRPSNIAFGGTDGCTCYLTMADRGTIEMFRTDTPGRSWRMFQDRKPIAVADNRMIPERFNIIGNTPNPFNSSTTIEYSLDAGMNIELTVFNSIGQKIEVLEAGYRPAGRNIVRWSGNMYPSGVYFCVLGVNGSRISRKMLLLK